MAFPIPFLIGLYPHRTGAFRYRHPHCHSTVAAVTANLPTVISAPKKTSTRTGMDHPERHLPTPNALPRIPTPPRTHPQKWHFWGPKWRFQGQNWSFRWTKWHFKYKLGALYRCKMVFSVLKCHFYVKKRHFQALLGENLGFSVLKWHF